MGSSTQQQQQQPPRNFIPTTGLDDDSSTPKKAKDVPFAVFFIAHLLLIAYYAFRYGGMTVMIESTESTQNPFHNNIINNNNKGLTDATAPFEYDNPFATGISTHMNSYSSSSLSPIPS